MVRAEQLDEMAFNLLQLMSPYMLPGAAAMQNLELKKNTVMSLDTYRSHYASLHDPHDDIRKRHCMTFTDSHSVCKI